MDPRFAAVVENLHPAFERLIARAPISGGKFLSPLPMRGVYLFSEGHQHLYVGRSNNLRQRYSQHCNPSSQHNQAVFAFKLARHETGKTEAVYSGDDRRAILAQEPTFKAAFAQAKIRVKNMDYRYVEEIDQTRQALLELYCAVALECPYNDFNTH